MTVLEPGQQHPLLPHVPADTVLISADDRAKLLSQRIQENYGRIDAPTVQAVIGQKGQITGMKLDDANYRSRCWYSD